MDGVVTYATEEHVATITLNRPDVRNAINEEMARELDDAVQRAALDDDVWVVVLAGKGQSFCAGLDLRRPSDATGPQQKRGARNRARSGNISWSALKLLQLEKPTIAAVRGHAYGGGLGLALACDIRVASEDARFCAVFTRLGLSLDSGTSLLLPRIVGYAKACELAFTAREVSGKEALELGLANMLVDSDQVEQTALDLAHSINMQAPIAVRLAKRSLRREWGDQILAAVEYEMYTATLTTSTMDYEEGRTAYREKRPPRWSNR